VNLPPVPPGTALFKDKTTRIYPRYPRWQLPVTHFTGGTGGKTQRLHMRYTLWDATGWHRDYSPPAWRNRATEEQKRIG
jgi:hypothetical protein